MKAKASAMITAGATAGHVTGRDPIEKGRALSIGGLRKGNAPSVRAGLNANLRAGTTDRAKMDISGRLSALCRRFR
jgi:hypothetical protein